MTQPDCTQRLAEARAALHDLLMGKAVVQLRYSDGETVEYAPQSIPALRAYIRDLEGECGGPGGVAVRRRPAHFVY